MRLLLDAHLSDRRLGEPLRERGHDVRTINQDRTLERLSDDLVLELAAAEGRILGSFDKGDMMSLLREWGAAGRSHAGAIIVVGLNHRHYASVLRGIEKAFELYPAHDDWVGVTVFVSPGALR